VNQTELELLSFAVAAAVVAVVFGANKSRIIRANTLGQVLDP